MIINLKTQMKCTNSQKKNKLTATDLSRNGKCGQSYNFQKKKKKETLVNILPTKKRPEPKSNSELDQIFKEQMIQILNYFRKQTKINPPQFYEANITLITKPDQKYFRKENCQPISFINISAKILNKILAKQVQ